MFHGKALAQGWSFEDPNGNDTFSLTERPGWLRIRLGTGDEDVWTDGKTGAPFLLRRLATRKEGWAVETFVDLATPNGGYPALNAIGGLVFRDAERGAGKTPFQLSFGLQHNWMAGTEVILQKPGHNVKWAGPGANAAYLRLVRNAAAGTLSAFYKVHAEHRWTRLAVVQDHDLPAGRMPGNIEAGLFAKTWDGRVGGPAAVDFAYFGEPEGASKETTQFGDTETTLSEVNIASLKTFSVSGKQRAVLNGYREAEIMRHVGRGCLTHMWFGGDWPGYERTRIRIYVDGESLPSIDMAMGLGHGYGFGDKAAPWGSEKLGKTGHPSGVYNSYKIPFGKSVRVTAQRDRKSPDGADFWWIVRGTDNLPVTIAGVRLPGHARLKLHKLDNHRAEPYEEFALCDVKGSGALYQVTMAADGQRDTGHWKDISYLESIIRAYFDGSDRAVELSSGLEDYFLGTYYFNRGRYANALAGLTHLDKKENTFSGYRFHDEDPVFFEEGLRLTCRCGEFINGKKLHDAPGTIFTTYTWVYHW